MAGATRVELPEILDVVQRDRGLAQNLVLRVDGFHARQVQHRVEQHRGVAHREDEAVAVRPDRVFRVEAQDFVPEQVGDRGHRHRRAGVAGVRGLHGVHRERADGVDCELVERVVGGTHGG
jgi:hypothetical protein